MTPASRGSGGPAVVTSTNATDAMIWFATELARHSVRVDSLHPTGVATPMGSGDMQAASARRWPATSGRVRCP